MGVVNIPAPSPREEHLGTTPTDPCLAQNETDHLTPEFLNNKIASTEDTFVWKEPEPLGIPRIPGSQTQIFKKGFRNKKRDPITGGVERGSCKRNWSQGFILHQLGPSSDQGQGVSIFR